MSMTVVMILVGVMCVAMIWMVMGYLNKGYSYKHTVDELPDKMPYEGDKEKVEENKE